MRSVIEIFQMAVQLGWMENLADCWTSFIGAADVPLSLEHQDVFDSHLPMQQTRNGPLPLHQLPEGDSEGGEWFRHFAERPEVVEAGERWFERLKKQHR